MEDLQKLTEIAGGKNLSKADKQFIIELSEKMQVAFTPKGRWFTPKGRCENCYKDQAVILYRLLSKESNADSGRAYLLRPSIDVIFKGKRYNNTCSDEELKEAIAAGLPLHLFERYADNK